ncbi:hypothetical protein TNIN_2541 [Trichonephila inaurata madagascariensis]|uniref:Uncharacterized protein n=1 Tax=Trichonephila inaurata madagascariensis TaxID=2747483 RepID=A0A8X6YLY4_9ARAC|nr:hypothetical protein TNIN_2541 [Trichonephila inaurata madagascariensis]
MVTIHVQGVIQRGNRKKEKKAHQERYTFFFVCVCPGLFFLGTRGRAHVVVEAWECFDKAVIHQELVSDIPSQLSQGSFSFDCSLFWNTVRADILVSCHLSSAGREPVAPS